MSGAKVRRTVEVPITEVLALRRHSWFATYSGTRYCRDCYEADDFRHYGNEWPCPTERLRERARAAQNGSSQGRS